MIWTSAIEMRWSRCDADLILGQGIAVGHFDASPPGILRALLAPLFHRVERRS
jgi:hypothetical protein